jgi:NADPH:quinone reductase-like Zn-dependent oxidoreductase
VPMRALTLNRLGDPEALTVVEDHPDPVPGTGDVLVRVEAAGYTPTELGWDSTSVDRSGHDRLPSVPCFELSGTVAGFGFGAKGFALGDEVFGLGDWYRDGGAAELVTIEARNLAAKPRSVDHATAAALPLAGLTAWQALFVHGNLQAGQTVLVLGAAGGVGALAVQMAHTAGARVLAVARGKDRDAVLGLGADAFHEDAAEADDADLIFDTVGGDVLTRAHAATNAHLVSVADPGEGTNYFVVEPDRTTLTHIAASVDAGNLRPLVGHIAPLADSADAVRRKERYEIGGKLVISVR